MLTKEQAFTPLPDERNIPLDFNQHDFQFTRSWFKQRNQRTWSHFLLPRFGGGTPVNMIQIGVFEGYDLAWCCQQLLTHKDSRAAAIDPWLATTKLNAEYMEGCYRRALHNLKPWRRKVAVERGSSHDVLKQMFDNPPSIYGKTIHPGEWGLVVVDGDHNASAVYEDAVDSLRLAAPGGWLVFDDYFNRIEKAHHVQEGVANFLRDFGDKVKFEWCHRYCVCYSKV